MANKNKTRDKHNIAIGKIKMLLLPRSKLCSFITSSQLLLLNKLQTSLYILNNFKNVNVLFINKYKINKENMIVCQIASG